MKNSILLFTLLVGLFACNSEGDTPKEIIPPVKMAQIISDIYVAEYKSRQIGLSSDSSKIVFRNYELQTYDDYGVSDSIYKMSFSYYVDHPEKLENIYDMVIDSLSLDQQISNKMKARNKAKDNSKQ